jgi:hypothetical protein
MGEVKERFAPPPSKFSKQQKHSRRGFAISRRDAPEVYIYLSPPEGVGNAGCPLHPQPPVQKKAQG